MRYQLCCEYPHLYGLDFHIACYAQLWHLLGSALPTGISSLCGKDGDSHSRTSFQNCRKDSCLALLSHCGVLLVLHLCCTMWILGPLGVGVACTNAQSGRWGFAKALGLPYPGHTWPYGIAAYLCIPDSGDKMAIAIAAMVAWWFSTCTSESSCLKERRLKLQRRVVADEVITPEWNHFTDRLRFD